MATRREFGGAPTGKASKRTGTDVLVSVAISATQATWGHPASVRGYYVDRSYFHELMPELEQGQQIDGTVPHDPALWYTTRAAADMGTWGGPTKHCSRQSARNGSSNPQRFARAACG